MNLIMGYPRVRAIVVLDSKIDKNMQRYAIQSTVDDNPDFVLMKEETYRERSCYVRFPKQDSLYKALKNVSILVRPSALNVAALLTKSLN